MLFRNELEQKASEGRHEMKPRKEEKKTPLTSESCPISGAKADLDVTQKKTSNDHMKLCTPWKFLPSRILMHYASTWFENNHYRLAGSIQQLFLFVEPEGISAMVEIYASSRFVSNSVDSKFGDTLAPERTRVSGDDYATS